MAPADTPYLSFVAAARNDDHGGNLLARMQTFVNALLGQCRRHNLAAELVLVEWNPPPDRPSLAEALRWPSDPGPCQVRLIRVPPEIHRRHRHAEVLPLYQMIAKNTGIRRAHGRFILATNIDILFSDELMRFFAARHLQTGRMYRIDRTDIESNVPAGASIDEQLEYCRTHSIRLNAREGTFGLTPDGLRALASVDIAAPASGLHFGAGWFAVEQHAAQPFRWASDVAELVVDPPFEPGLALAMDIEPGPGVNGAPFALEVRDQDGSLIANSTVTRRCVLLLPVEPGPRKVLVFRVIGGGLAVPHDARILNFRVFDCRWRRPAESASVAPENTTFVKARGFRSKLSRGWRLTVGALRLVKHLLLGNHAVRVGLPISARLIERLQPQVDAAGLSVLLTPLGVRPAPPVPDPPERVSGVGPVHLHTNGCGDFTLLAREHWHALRGYPEFDMFSMNLDSVLCWTAHHSGAREEVLASPMRIYHIEHARGSGWTPEGEATLFDRLTDKGIPWLETQRVLELARQMNLLDCPMIFNLDNWGLASENLLETVIGPRAVATRRV
jgi:hypothetical protein